MKSRYLSNEILKLSSLCQCIVFIENAWDVVKPQTSKGIGKVCLFTGSGPYKKGPSSSRFLSSLKINKIF